LGPCRSMGRGRRPLRARVLAAGEALSAALRPVPRRDVPVLLRPPRARAVGAGTDLHRGVAAPVVDRPRGVGNVGYLEPRCPLRRRSFDQRARAPGRRGRRASTPTTRLGLDAAGVVRRRTSARLGRNARFAAPIGNRPVGRRSGRTGARRSASSAAFRNSEPDGVVACRGRGLRRTSQLLGLVRRRQVRAAEGACRAGTPSARRRPVGRLVPRRTASGRNHERTSADSGRRLPRSHVGRGPRCDEAEPSAPSGVGPYLVTGESTAPSGVGAASALIRRDSES
jgi:hypothetical protein